MASSEWPPSSKNLSWTPMGATPNRFCHTSAIADSTGLDGATYWEERLGRAWSFDRAAAFRGAERFEPYPLIEARLKVGSGNHHLTRGAMKNAQERIGAVAGQDEVGEA